MFVWKNCENSSFGEFCEFQRLLPKIEFQMLKPPLAFGILEFQKLIRLRPCLVKCISDKELDLLGISDIM